MTKLGERLFNPLVGTDTTSYLFELTTTFSANSLIEEIENVLGIYEPRITLDNITVNAEDDSNEFEVIIEYFIVGLPYSTNRRFYPRKRKLINGTTYYLCFRIQSNQRVH